MHIVIASSSNGAVLTPVGDDGVAAAPSAVTTAALPAEVARLERDSPRWVWESTELWYPSLLRAGVRVARCVDLRLCHAILRNSEASAGSALASAPPSSWDLPPGEVAKAMPDALFDFDTTPDASEGLDPLAEFLLQQQALTPRLSLLLAAESAGALAAVEMRFAGLPWRADLHDELLTRTLGPRPRPGERPVLMEEVLGALRLTLDAPSLNPDSQPELLRALRRAGLMVSSTSKWELQELEHPAVAPLLEYKRMARLLSANGWHWLETNVRDGRFHPDYVPAGVVTGRWASKGGGGALQLPKQVRGAVVADPGRKLVVADASQLEPRILAGMAADRGMIEAGSAGDLYAGIVASGAVGTREQAKIAMLGAMYGATSGESGRLMPALERAYPRAIALVEAAARAGERGQKVSTLLGRGSPLPDAQWHQVQAEASEESAAVSAQSRARSQARSWGRFTRNFVVQGTAAEWALCWMAALRGSLYALGGRSPLLEAPHLVFFMHDELVIDTEARHADAVVAAVEEAAATAGRLLFGELPVRFPLTIAVVDSYADAK
ncbi:DNA polymerase-1 [Homoserinimonas aerilata]|uniref:DNA-directed DNA polymerase n=1 Tax=Homoserinimonas aerilata TaxID=1162970 RepID=A0A542YIH0_9MICO|nr:bifunctional 3'-5' exonuclease/DNA polymerase [Homoserinimonas aerilata]TQL47882.1 DNA polymerase-1 [Homoserinimonas aerilata]